MIYIKNNSVIRIICLTITIVAVIFLAIYINSNLLYQQCNGIIYDPNQKEASRDYTSSLIEVDLSDTVSSNSTTSINNIPQKFKTTSTLTGSPCISSIQTNSTVPEESSSNNVTSIEINDNTNNTTTSREENLPPYTPPSPSIPSSTPSSEISSSTSSETSSQTSSQTSSEVVDDPILKENMLKAAAISNNYGIYVIIASSKSDFSSELITDYAINSQEIKSGLVQIESSLKSFPTRYFGKTSTNINVVLVSNTTTDNIITVDSKIIVPCFKTVSSSEINDFLLNISAQKLSEYVTPNYDTCNPPNFIYGCPQTKYNYTSEPSRSAYFISSEAQLSVEKDLYENFMAIFKNVPTLQKVSTSSPYFKKLSYTYKLLVEWSDCFSEISIVKRFL